MHKKRGQITLFIIVGILILFVFAFFMYVTKLNLKSSPEFGKLEDIIYDSFERASNNALIYVSKQGGIYIIDDLDNESILFYDEYRINEFGSSRIIDINGMELNKEPILVQEITITSFERAISTKTKDLLEEYLKSSDEFKAARIVENVDIEIKTEIKDGGVEIEMKYPIIYETKGTLMSISKKTTHFPVRLGDMITVSNSFIENNDNYLLNYHELDQDYDHIKVDMYKVNKQDVLFVSAKNKINGEFFRFVVAIEN